MKLIPLTRGHVAQVSDCDYPWISQHSWCAVGTLLNNRYARRMDADRQSITMHLEVAKRMGIVGLVDHQDRNTFNNQRENLRPCTVVQNAQNRGKRANAKFRYKGVVWTPHMQQWRARITLNKKLIHLGYFFDEADAARAYDEAARTCFGAFACPNFP